MGIENDFLPANEKDALTNPAGYFRFDSHDPGHAPPTEAPSDFLGTQIFYKGWRDLCDLVSRHERCGGKIAGHIEHGGEDVRDGIDGDEQADSFGGQTDGEEERREHDERAARNAGDGEGEEDRCERDRGQTAGVNRNSVEPADEECADGP